MNFRQAEFSVEQMVGIITNEPNEQELRVSQYKQYYAGYHNVLYGERQEKYLGSPEDLFPNSPLNISELVVKVVTDRLSIIPDGGGIKELDKQSQSFAEYCSKVWVHSDLNSIQNKLHEYVMRDGQAALIVEWLEGQPIFSVQHIYDGSTGVRFHVSEFDDDYFMFCSKVWEVRMFNEVGSEVDGVLRMNLYVSGFDDQPALVYRYWSETGDNWTPLTDEEVMNETANTSGENPQPLPISAIPIIRFYNNPKQSEIHSAYILQLLSDKGTLDIDRAVDYHSFPLLVGESGLKENTGVGPGKGLKGVNIRRLDPPDIEKMWDGSVLKWLYLLSIVKRWPLWILDPQTFSVPSGTALKVAERPLVSQIVEKQKDLDKGWKRTFEIVKMYSNELGTEKFEEDTRIRFEWINPQTENVIEDQAMQVSTALQANLPFETIWAQVFGFDKGQINQIKKLQEEDIGFKRQQAEIMQILNQMLVSRANAAEFVGANEQQVLQLMQANPNEFGRGTNGSGTTN